MTTTSILNQLANAHDNYIPFHAAYDALGIDSIEEFHQQLLELSRNDVLELRTSVHHEGVQAQYQLKQRYGTPLYYIVMNNVSTSSVKTATSKAATTTTKKDTNMKKAATKKTEVKAEVKEVAPTTAAGVTLTYRELQQALKALRDGGKELQVKLNSKTEVLQAEYARLTGSSVAAPTKAPTPAQVNGITYRELQAQLKALKLDGKTTIKLNHKYDILLAELQRLQAA